MKEKSNEQKNPKEKGILETIREVNEKERQQRIHSESERVKRESREKEHRNEEYGKQLYNEKIEIMKMKQGLTEENQFSDTTEAVEYTFWQKTGAFIYCNKAMIIVAALFLFIAAYLIYDLATKERPDFTAMILVDDQDLDVCCDRLEEIVEEYIEDTNGNGEILSAMYYMPISNDLDPYTQQASSTKLFAIMQDGDTILVIGNKEVEDFLLPDQTLENLEELYPDNEHVKGYGFYLSGTGFAEDIGYEGELAEDVFIGLRKVKEGERYEEKMQKNYDAAKALLDNLIERYS